MCEESEFQPFALTSNLKSPSLPLDLWELLAFRFNFPTGSNHEFIDVDTIYFTK